MAGYHPELAKKNDKPSKFNIVGRLLNIYTNKSMTRNSSWITVPGLVRCISILSSDCVCIDYTFMTKTGEFMAGVERKSYCYLEENNGLFPFPCKVSYNPHNPMFNKLLSIEWKTDKTGASTGTHVTL